MNLHLKDLLTCVSCNTADLELTSLVQNSEDQIETGYLSCAQCQAVYPIIEGVPILFRSKVLKDFLLDFEIEAIKKHNIPLFSNSYNLNDFEKQQQRTHKNWTHQWLELDTAKWHEEFGATIGTHEENHAVEIPIPIEDYDQKVICEASCGYGRNLQAIHHRPAHYVAFDLSASVYKCAKKFKDSKTIDIVRADMLHPPFKKHSFDIVFSPRAMHHVGSCSSALHRLCGITKHGGQVGFSIYSKENNILMWGLIEPLKKFLLNHFPLKFKLVLAHVLAGILRPIIHLIYVPMNKWNIKCLPLHQLMMFWTSLSHSSLTLTLYDLLHAPLVEYTSKATLEQWESDHNFTRVGCTLMNSTIWNYAGRLPPS